MPDLSTERIARFVRRQGFAAVPKTIFRKLWRKLFADRHLVFSLSGESFRPSQSVAELEIARYGCEADIPALYLQQLASEEGSDFLNNTKRGFADGGVFWIGIIGQSVVAYQWSCRGSTLMHWFVPLQDDDIVIFATVTFPRWRGLGISPAMMQCIIAHELAGHGRAFVDCKVWNKAAIRGIAKAGFQRVGEPMKPLSSNLLRRVGPAHAA